MKKVHIREYMAPETVCGENVDRVISVIGYKVANRALWPFIAPKHRCRLCDRKYRKEKK